MYGKHYESMYTGSMLGAGAVVFAVWGYVVAHVKPPDYEVELNPMMLSFMIGEPEQKVIEAIEKLCSPDPKSRSKDREGRRLIQRGQFLYWVVNGEAYGQIKTDSERRQYWREQKRIERSKAKELKTDEPKEPDAPPPRAKLPDVPIPVNLAESLEFNIWWNKWLEHLKNKRSSPSVNAKELQLAKLSKMGLERAIAALKHSIESNWKGIYEQHNNNTPAALPGLDSNDMRNYL